MRETRKVVPNLADTEGSIFKWQYVHLNICVLTAGNAFSLKKILKNLNTRIVKCQASLYLYLLYPCIGIRYSSTCYCHTELSAQAWVWVRRVRGDCGRFCFRYVIFYQSLFLVTCSSFCHEDSHHIYCLKRFWSLYALGKGSVSDVCLLHRYWSWEKLLNDILGGFSTLVARRTNHHISAIKAPRTKPSLQWQSI